MHTSLPPCWMRALRTAAVIATIAPIAASAAEPPARGAPDLAAAALRIVDATIAFRREQGLQAVQVDATLVQTAAAFARDMADNDRYGHESDGRNPVQRAQAQGYRHCTLAENIAFLQQSQGFTTTALADGLAQGWEQSPPHRHNMLSPDATQTGVAVAHSARSDRYYAVQLLGRPWSQRMRFTVANEAGQAVAYRVAGQRLTLPPRAVRTHTVCGVTQLMLPRGGAWREIDAEDGARYAVDAPAADAAAVR